MKAKHPYLTGIVVVAAIGLLVACGTQPAITSVPAEAPMEVVETTVETLEQPPLPQEVQPSPMPTATPPTADGVERVSYSTTSSSRPNRLIVKNAELKLLVTDTDIAIDLALQVAADCGGYVVSSRVWYEQWQGEHYKYATITLGVPVDQFERAMRRLRGLALRVVDETAAGQDVTDEYVDLQSRLDNLIATRDRIREFLEQAQTVEESLRVNEELAAVEEQIEQVQGRMNYLFDRVTYSTITISLTPELPPITPTPTPSPTPTPTPPPPWTPAETVEQAGRTLGAIVRVLIEISIWMGIVVAPIVAPPGLIIWIIRRRKRSS